VWKKRVSDIEGAFSEVDLDIAGQIAIALAAAEEPPEAKEIWEAIGVPRRTVERHRAKVLLRAEQILAGPQVELAT
jgi:FixJ family two-component response regulator